MELKVNPQDILINSHNGIYLVDAGAGTGKTYTIIKRYREIIKKKVKPEEILLITFTKNAANQMKQDIITKVSDLVEITDLIDAPVSTFHSFCGRILKTSGKNAPSFIGVDRIIPPNYGILEDDFFEEELFDKFILKFLKNGKKKFSKVILSLGVKNDYTQILTIIKKLSSLGIMPARKGWYGNSYERLTGNYEKFSELFDYMNAPVEGARVPKQNNLYKIFNERKNDPFVDFPSDKIFKDKEISPEIKDTLFNDPERNIFIDFLREVYMAYIEEMLRRNLMNYDFMIMFAYITLLENRAAREREQFEYIMVDEFQDTDEIQMKIIMLLCKPNAGKINLCVVGDWKQGIYGFRNATITNITGFEENLISYKAELNKYKDNEPDMIKYDVMPVNKISLGRNYRSSQKILDFSRHTLFTKAGEKDSVDYDTVNKNFPKPLEAIRKLGDITEIKFYCTHENERENELTLILKKISELVNETEKYRIREFDKITGDVIIEREVKYSDICVLSRTKKFGLELQREAIKQGIPANYSGGLEIFASPQGILVLNWMKLIANSKISSSWIPVLEAEGYNHKEIKYFINQIDADKQDDNTLFTILPENLLKFLKYLSAISDNIIYIVESVLSRYGYRDEIPNRIISAVRGWLDSESYSLSEIASIIENNLTNEFSLEINSTENAFLIQTIHGSKGLEYPVVFLSNCNVRSFPSSRGDSSAIYFNEITGIRFMKLYNDSGKFSAVLSNWRSVVMKGMVKGVDYDEERRLLYVAVTRAKQYLYITSFNPSSFFTELAERSEMMPVMDYDYLIKPVNQDYTDTVFNEKIDFAASNVKRLVSPHDYLNFKIYNKYDDYPGKEFAVNPAQSGVDFGNIVHSVADKIAKGINVSREYDEVEKIYKLIEGFSGADLRSEIDFILPLEDRVIRGTIDLMAVYDDSVTVLDYKTDKNLNNFETYKMQMSFYYMIASAIYPDKKIQCKLYFIVLDEMAELDNAELESIFRNTISIKEN